MAALIFALLVLLAGAAAAALLWRKPDAADAAAQGALAAGCAVGLAGAASLAASGERAACALSWPLPGARLSLAIDPLSTFFLILVFGVCALAGFFGDAYARRSRSLSSRRLLRPWFLLLTASMAGVVCAANAFVFLLAWELMALASFFLIVTEHESPGVRGAGLVYFVCTHTATLALFLLFALLGRAYGSLEFEAIRAAGPASPRLSLLALPLALLAFGTKAGLAPLHIWLQEAHPAAPSHVSALMSGVVIKIGIYGFLRTIWLLRAVPPAWSFWLVVLGAVSGVGGVLFALAQHDLKRLLAYHSVENIGIIALGMGLGCLGLSHARPDLALLGFLGAILHTLNHGLFKSLLFLGSGVFQRALGTRDIEAGGGLLKTMPWTSGLALLAAAAICGIPPLNGFVSEWFVYLAAFRFQSSEEARLCAAAAASLALIGGLAIACFTKAYGALCLGQPRTQAAASAGDPQAEMLAPMAVLAAACAGIGLWPGPAALLAARAAGVVCGQAPERTVALIAAPLAAVALVGRLAVGLVALIVLLSRARACALGGRVRAGATWGCGFTVPGARQQYTASSFAQPLTRMFGPALAAHVDARAPSGYWPTSASFESHTGDRVLDGALLPAGSLIERGLSWLKRRWRSRLQYYMLYVSLFLFVVLYWKL